MLTFSKQTGPQPIAQSAPSQADEERKRDMREAWKAYRGDFQDPLKIAKDQPNDNVKANRSGPIVDKGVSFLFGQVLKIEAEDAYNEDEGDEGDEDVPGGDTDGDPAQDYLDGFWGDDDDKMTSLNQIGINGGVCGQSFVKLIPARGDDDYPRLVILDPLLVRPITAPDDCQLVLAYIIEYPSTSEIQKRQVIARVDMALVAEAYEDEDIQDTWTITNFQRTTQGSRAWEQVGPAEAWPWPFPPIFSCQNLPNPNEYWGRPDLTPDLILMNKVLCFIESNTSRIIKYHGHPKTWAKGIRSEQISVAVDGVICLESPNAEMGMLKPMESFDGLLAFAETVRANMDEQSRIPSVALGRLSELPKGNISGVALQLLFQPLIEKTIQKQRLYGRMIRDISRAVLVMAGLIPVKAYNTYKVTLHWQNLLPVDDLLAAQTAVLWNQLGVSSHTLLQGAGFDPDAEVEKTAKEEAAKPKPPVQPNLGGVPPAGQQPPQQGGEQAA